MLGLRRALEIEDLLEIGERGVADDECVIENETFRGILCFGEAMAVANGSITYHWCHNDLK